MAAKVCKPGRAAGAGPEAPKLSSVCSLPTRQHSTAQHNGYMASRQRSLNPQCTASRGCTVGFGCRPVLTITY